MIFIHERVLPHAFIAHQYNDVSKKENLKPLARRSQNHVLMVASMSLVLCSSDIACEQVP